MYWKICWKYVSPGLIIIIFIASIVNLAINPMQYSAWDAENVSLGFILITTGIIMSVSRKIQTFTLPQVPGLHFSEIKQKKKGTLKLKKGN